MKLSIISDTHGFHDKIKLRDADIFIHCGDFTAPGVGKEKHVKVFFSWLNSIASKYKAIIFISGNHDFPMEGDHRFKRNVLSSLKPNIYYLENSSVIIDNVKFYGSPYTPEFNNWAFMMPVNGKGIKENWKKIPNDVDVLITHGPSKNILDKNISGHPCGCKYLAREVKRIRPKIHCHGHIHEGRGSNPYIYAPTVVYNVSSLDYWSNIIHDPIEVEI